MLIPLRIEPVALTPPFSDHEAVDLTSSTSRGRRGPAARHGPVRRRGRTRAGRGQAAVPARTPGVWEAPARNPFFVGRDRLLDQLDATLRVSRQRAVVLPHDGLGATGRTQLAVEYAHRFRAAYDLVWWIRAHSRESVLLSLARLADRLGLRGGDDVPTAARRALDALDSGAGAAGGSWPTTTPVSRRPCRGCCPAAPTAMCWSPPGTPPGARPCTPCGSTSSPGSRASSCCGGWPRCSRRRTRTGSPPRWGPSARRRAGRIVAGAVPVGTRLPAPADRRRRRDAGGRAGRPGRRHDRGRPRHPRRPRPAALRLLALCGRLAPLPLPLALAYTDTALALLRPHDASLHGPMLVDREVRNSAGWVLRRSTRPATR
ncbi:hypothetical protein ACFQ60_45695 [Streptomyces zhihengii]